jgi:hypothetical protein
MTVVQLNGYRIGALYRKVFGERARSFHAYGNNVTACDDSGGFVVCDINYADGNIAELIAELLNEARDRTGVEGPKG